MRTLLPKTATFLMVIASLRMQTAAPENVCVTAESLKPFNLVRTNPQVVSNGTCKALYSTGGACVAVSETLAELRRKYDWLRTKAIEAKNYNHQRANASVYFQVRNGQMTKMEAQTRLSLSTSPASSILSTVTNIVASIASTVTNMFGGMPEWIKKNFDMGNDQINPCFQAIQNMTDSAYCVFTSANTFGRFSNPQSTSDQRSPAFMIAANLRTAGQTLRQCTALIDTYCTLSYGVSVLTASRPFSQTFNWGDNSGISEATCSAMAGYMNSTMNTDVAAMDTLYVNMFHTGWIRFVPSQQAIDNLGAFLRNKEFDKEPREFNPIQSAPTGLGLGISTVANQGVEADLSEIAKTTNAPVNVYSAGRLAISFVVAALGLMAV